jgi:exoribonuclease R
MLTIPVVGVLELSSKYRYGLTSRGAPLYLFRPYDESLPEFVVGSSERDTSVNRIAIVDVPVGAAAAATVTHATRFTEPKPRGNLIRLIGPVGNYDAEFKGLLEHYCPAKQHRDVPISAPDTYHDAACICLDAANGWITFHIDPAGCLDIDDAMAYNPETQEWAITIADAAAAVPAGSLVDEAAAAIGSTFYDINGHAERPMLPRAISEESASLRPGVPRRGVSLLLGPDGQQRWALSWITVTHSFTYENFTGSQIARDLGLAAVEPHQWIADQMIRYNSAAAARLKEAAAGLLRTQAPADAAAAANWDSIDPALVRLAHEAARYEPASAGENQWHAGLGLAAYTHASSPLRRYADLVNQRVLKALIQREPLPPMDPRIATDLTERQRMNRRWTRDITFLEYVTPGKVHTIDVIWVDQERVWVPTWQRLLRIRHDGILPPGTRGRIDIFCDPSQRNWKRRVMTASTDNSN